MSQPPPVSSDKSLSPAPPTALHEAAALEAGGNAYLAFWSALTPLTLDRLATVTTEDVRFKDPFNDVTGRPALRRVLEHMFTHVTEPRFVVRHWAWAGPRLMLLRWSFSGRVAVLGDWSVEGMSEVTFAADGRVSTHIDHWDAAEQVYGRIPGLALLLRLSRRRMAAE